jgi:peptidyl-prolyl cis-trans isomerase D
LIPGADAQKTADSLMAIIKANPTQWDSINIKFSSDATSKANNGDLGYQAQGMFVAPFNDLIFNKAVPGEYNTVATQFGVHIVQVTGVKAGANAMRAKMAYVREGIMPSAETDKRAAAAADELLTSGKTWAEIKTKAQAKNLSILPSPGFKSSEVSLGAFGRSDGVRQIIRWAYEASIGERTKTTFAMREEGEGYNSRYVIAGLKSITPKGLPAVKDIKEQLTPFVKNKKKGEVLKSKITAQDLNTVAGQFNAKIDTARGVTFNANFVPNLGAEPRVLGTAFTTEIGQTSKAVVGESGVFVLSVDAKNPIANSPVDKNVLRQQLVTPVMNTLRGTLVRALRKNSSITDNRMKFF